MITPFPSRASSTAPPLAELRLIDGRITAHTLVLIGWIAVVGQLAAVFVVEVCLGYDLPENTMVAAIGILVAVNLLLVAESSGGRPRLSDRLAVVYLGFDTLQLGFQLYQTGGLENPFALMMLAPLTVGAATLGGWSVMVLLMINLACLSALGWWHLPLPWPEHRSPHPSLYTFGTWVSLTLGAVLITAFVYRVARDGRRVADALSVSQSALGREQRLSALGGLAAAAAHELGTPLGTIALVAKEMAREVPPESPLASDIALLQSQSQRCRDILAELSRRPEMDHSSPFNSLALTALVEEAADRHLKAVPIALVVRRGAEVTGPEPQALRCPEILHGLGNLLQNALQFARRQVTVTAVWNREDVALTVADDGPGFHPHLLARIGEPYLSTRAHQGGHMGLGIFIAQTLLERTGASIEFGNNRGGGARVVVRWKRKDLEAGLEKVPASTKECEL